MSLNTQGLKRCGSLGISAWSLSAYQRKGSFIWALRNRRSASSASHEASRSDSPQYDQETDVIIVGSGCSGLTTAIVAAKLGLKAIVLEKSNYLGGTTAYSGGGAWIPANKHQAAIGVQDGPQQAEQYLRTILGESYSPKLATAFIQSGPEMVEWMERNSDMQFKPVPLPDYHPTQPGASVGRTLLTEAFDGSMLGRRVKDIRYPLQGYSAFGSMQADPEELAVLTNPFGKPGNLVKVARKLTRYLVDLVRYGKGAVLANGNALVGRLVYTCAQNSIPIWKNTPALGPIFEGGKLTGLAVSRDGSRTMHLKAAKGVVLASGGFGRSDEAKALLSQEWTVQPRGIVGDGKRIGVESGGFLPPPNADNGIYAPISLSRAKDPVRRFPHFAIDRAKPGSIIVGPDGRRFANEAEPYQEFVKQMQAKNIQEAYFIGDATFLRKYGMGMALPWPYPSGHLVRSGYLVKAPTLSQLAEKLNLPSEALIATVEECNENAFRGKDREFQRGTTIYDQFYGDRSNNGRNPNLGRCETGPFYAVKLYPGNVSTIWGLSVDENAQVLDAAGAPIERLYAVGCDQNSLMRGHYPGGGSSIGPAMTFAYRAGLHLAGEL